VEKVLRHRSRVWTIPTEGPRRRLHHEGPLLWGAHLFPDYCPLRMRPRHQHTGDELSLHDILWASEACFTSGGAFNVHTSHLWARDNPYVIRERGYQVRFSVSVWTDVVGDIVPGLCGHNDTAIFLKLFYLGCLKMCVQL
jgi:hypothetical protein